MAPQCTVAGRYFGSVCFGVPSVRDVSLLLRRTSDKTGNHFSLQINSLILYGQILTVFRLQFTCTKNQNIFTGNADSSLRLSQQWPERHCRDSVHIYTLMQKLLLCHVVSLWVLLKLLSFSMICDGLLDCFNCNNVSSLDECHTTTQCRLNEMCYTESYQLGINPKQYSLGCREKELCTGIDETPYIGRRRRQQAPQPLNGCVQCCSLHGCNKYLCPVTFTTRLPTVSVDGGWTTWGPWESCSASCGIGLQSRHRTCSSPPPSGNGRNCLGDAKDVNLCNIPCTDKPTLPPRTSAPTMSKATKPGVPPTMQPATRAPIKTVTSNSTLAPGECLDLIDCSKYYPPEACHGVYEAWARAHCLKHCGFCTDPHEVPTPCVDTVSNCQEYQSDICTSLAFWQWRESHCRKFCKLC